MALGRIKWLIDFKGLIIVFIGIVAFLVFHELVFFVNHLLVFIKLFIPAHQAIYVFATNMLHLLVAFDSNFITVVVLYLTT